MSVLCLSDFSITKPHLHKKKKKKKNTPFFLDNVYLRFVGFSFLGDVFTRFTFTSHTLRVSAYRDKQCCFSQSGPIQLLCLTIYSMLLEICFLDGEALFNRQELTGIKPEQKKKMTALLPSKNVKVFFLCFFCFF